MNKNIKAPKTLEEVKINVRIKLSALWAAIMFLFIYVDHFALFIPGIIEDIQGGEIAGFQINQYWLLSAMMLMMVPSLMVFLSLILKAKANRWINIIVGIIYIVFVIGNTIGETWVFYIFASIVEIVLLLCIVGYAWKWPKLEGQS